MNTNNIFGTCYFMGGLGNQMFQAAHTLSQAWKKGVESKFKAESWTPMQGRQTDNYRNNIFRNLNFVEDFGHVGRVSEGPWEYTELNPQWDQPQEFYGYFQSSKNFLGYDKEIQKTFEPTEEFIDRMINRYPELTQEKTLSVHIRRGDCFMNPDIHPMVTKEYVERALELVPEYSNIFIFSDDKIWIKENFNFPNMIIVDELEDYEEMWLMSLCKNHIISNSTFSWWGTFLNKKENKKIIAPSIWFGPRGPQNFKDIYEPYWTVLEVTYKDGWLY
jgi:hypothetical protein